jgi:hypothetical protein
VTVVPLREYEAALEVGGMRLREIAVMSALVVANGVEARLLPFAHAPVQV